MKKSLRKVLEEREFEGVIRGLLDEFSQECTMKQATQYISLRDKTLADIKHAIGVRDKRLTIIDKDKNEESN